MELRRTDFLVGLFILASVGVLVGVAVLTSGLGVPRYDLYMRAVSAADLTQDTRVLLQGLAVGRVQAVSPAIDSATGTISVVAKLSMMRRFPNGTELKLPVGTRAVISQQSPLGGAVVQLFLPTATAADYLADGDTITASRQANVLDAVNDVMGNLQDQLTLTLEDTRRLLEHTTRAVDQTNTLLAATSDPLESALRNLASGLQRTDHLLAELTPRVTDLSDSVIVTLSDARRVLASVDSLTTLGHAMAAENRDAIREAIAHLSRSAEVLEHFADKVSRRPLRMLTGVTPPPPEPSKGAAESRGSRP